MFTDSAFCLTNDEPIFDYDKKASMEYALEYPKSNVNWLRLFIESVKIWWMRREIKNFRENDLLID